jgi:glycosyltransferase involved in cell wall biosynthesis
MKTIDISVALPVYNEEGNVRELYQEIVDALTPEPISFEIVFCDDGSSDKSPQILNEIAQLDSRVKVIHLRRNYGQTGATSVAFENAQGSVVVGMDSDRQNDPKDIIKLYRKLQEGYDMVSGWRKDRKDGFLLRRFPSIMAHKLITRVTKVKLKDYGCSLKAYRKDVLQHVKLYGEMHRFVPAFVKNAGARITEVPVNHRARVAGVSKYGISRTYRVLLDLLTVAFLMKYFHRPMHFFGFPGFACLIAGISSGAYLSFIKIFQSASIGDRPLLMFSILTTILGAVFLSMGLLGEIMTRIYFEATNSPAYLVREIISNPNAKLPGSSPARQIHS